MKIIRFVKGQKWLRETIYFVLRFCGLPWLVRQCAQKKRVTIILYHDIAREVFHAHMQVISKAYNIISLEDYVKARQANDFSAIPDKALIVTFDDGVKSNYELLPVFQEFSFKPTIFICSSIVGTNRHFWWNHTDSDATNVMLKSLPTVEMNAKLAELGYLEEKEYDDRAALSDAEIEEMREFVDFQSHGCFHPMLPMCTEDRVKEELAVSKEQLENRYGFKINGYSYTNGDYSDRDVSLVQEAGYNVAITVDSYFNDENTDLLRLKRLCVPDDASVNEAIVNVSGLKIFLRKRLGKLNYGYQPNPVS